MAINRISKPQTTAHWIEEATHHPFSPKMASWRSSSANKSIKNRMRRAPPCPLFPWRLLTWKRRRMRQRQVTIILQVRLGPVVHHPPDKCTQSAKFATRTKRNCLLMVGVILPTITSITTQLQWWLRPPRDGNIRTSMSNRQPFVSRRRSNSNSKKLEYKSKSRLSSNRLLAWPLPPESHLSHSPDAPTRKTQTQTRQRQQLTQPLRWQLLTAEAVCYFCPGRLWPRPPNQPIPQAPSGPAAKSTNKKSLQPQLPWCKLYLIPRTQQSNNSLNTATRPPSLSANSSSQNRTFSRIKGSTDRLSFRPEIFSLRTHRPR